MEETKEQEQEVKKNGKKIVAPKTHSTKAIYEFYKKKFPNSKIPYWMFKEVIARYNKRASDAVIFGSTLNLGSKLGQVLIKKIRRNYIKSVPDWGASKAMKQDLINKGITPKGPEHPEGEDWIVFFTDPWYLRWAWAKKRICKVRNQTVYKFMPTSNRSKMAGDNSLGKLGNKGKLVLANKINPNLHNLYEFRTTKFDVQ
jgi:hypothetical protein